MKISTSLNTDVGELLSRAWKRRALLMMSGLPAIPALLGWAMVRPEATMRALSPLARTWKPFEVMRAMERAMVDVAVGLLARWRYGDRLRWDAGLVCLAFALAFIALRSLAREYPRLHWAKIVALAACLLSGIQMVMPLKGQDVALRTFPVLSPFMRGGGRIWAGYGPSGTLMAIVASLAAALYVWLLCDALRRWMLASGMVGPSYLSVFCGWILTGFCLLGLGVSLAGSLGQYHVAMCFLPVHASFWCVAPGASLAIGLLFFTLHLAGGLPLPESCDDPVVRRVQTDLEERNGGNAAMTLCRRLLGAALVLSPEQRYSAAGLWYLSFMGTIFVGSVCLGILALNLTTVPQDPHWRDILVPTVFLCVYWSMLLGLALPAAGAAWCIGRMLADSRCQCLWAKLTLLLLIVPMDLWLAASWLLMPSRIASVQPSLPYIRLFAKLAIVLYPLAAVIVAWAAFRVTRAVVLRQGTAWR